MLSIITYCNIPSHDTPELAGKEETLQSGLWG